MPASQPHAVNLRKGRYSKCGVHYFLTTSVSKRRQIFTDPERAFIILDAIQWLHDSGDFRIDAAVVMPDHVHLAGRLGESTLVKVMHTLKSYSANRLSKSGIKTPIWQKGYYDHAIRDDHDYEVRIQYLIENPVRAKLVAKPEDYEFVILPKGWSRKISRFESASYGV